MQHLNHLRRCQLVGSAALLILVSRECGAQRISSAPPAVPSYSILASAAVTETHPRLIRSITLGDLGSHRPSLPTDVIFLRGRIFVIDGMRRVLLVYDQDGNYLREATQWGDADGELTSPVRLVADHDTVLVLDLNHRNAVSAFDREGRFIGARFPELHSASAYTMAFGRATAAFGQLDAARRPERTVVAIMDRKGREIGAGCTVADSYTRSEARHGALATFNAAFVAIQGNRIYCAQSITPVVSVLDLSGTTVGFLPFAPPFYVAPSDIGETRNQKSLLDFQSKFTLLQNFDVTSSGFVSIFSRYDLAASQFTYRMFACDFDTKPKNCRVGTIPGRPVRIVSSDSVLSVVSMGDGSLRLNVLMMDR